MNINGVVGERKTPTTACYFLRRPAMAEMLDQSIDIVSLLADSKIFPSKGEARKTVQAGGVSINKIKVESVEESIDSTKLMHGKYLLVQKGKKNYYIIKAN